MAARVHSLADLPPDLRLEVETLYSGEARTGLACPACLGGRTQEASLAVRHEGHQLSLKCWRAGCGYYARIPVGADFTFSAPKRPPKPYTAALEPPDYGMRRRLFVRYGLAERAVDYGGIQTAMSELTQSIWMPVRDRLGYERGGIIRRLEKGVKPKAVSYKTTDSSWMAWYPRVNDGELQPLVIVEDQISALRAWQAGYSAVALLGTVLSGDRVAELEAIVRREPIALALDNDAFSIACGYCTKYSDRLNMRAVLLNKDLKDLYDDAEVRKALAG
jgi:hypothetical protein